MTRRFEIVGGQEPIGRKWWLHLNWRGGNGAQQDQHEDGQGDGADQADQRDDVQAVGERPARHLDQGDSGVPGELASDRDGLG